MSATAESEQEKYSGNFFPWRSFKRKILTSKQIRNHDNFLLCEGFYNLQS